MTRMLLVSGALVAAMIAAPSALLAAAGVDGTGSVGTCATTGKISLKPPLAGFPNPDTTPPDTVKVQTKTPKGAVCTGTRSGDGANVTSASSKGGGTTAHSSCASLAGTTNDTLTLTVKWKAAKGTPKLNPSVITTTSQTGGISGDNMHGAFDITGTVTSGSFTGDTVTAHIETDAPLGDIINQCNGKGIKSISFGAAGTSSVSIN